MPDDLVHLTTSFVDSSNDEWETIERQSNGVDPALLRELKVLAGIADFHRTLHNGAARAVPGDWGSLVLRGELGAGSFGSVYRAWDPALEREVALKIYRLGSHDAPLASLLGEGRLLARVRHPHVVIVHGVERRGDEVGLWLELIDGRTLADEVRTGGPLGSREAALVGQDLCRALAAVHQAGLLHRDVKPQNVMRERGGRIVLMDFGLGRLAAPSLPPTTDGDGTPLYMAPELFAGRPATTASDIYSLGVLLFFLVTGTHPVTAASRTELERAHGEGRRKLLTDVRPDLPESFAQVIERACAPDPSKRFPTAGTMQAALATAIGLPADDAVIAERRSRRFAWATGVLAATVLVFIALFVVVRDRPGVPPSLSGEVKVAPPAPVASPTSAKVPAGPEYQIEAGLQRVRADTGPEKLTQGQRVRPGDLLFLTLRASRPVHVYVVTQDESGESYLLFPLPGLAVKNPLTAAKAHKLPGRLVGEETYWKVTSAGGREHLLIVASLEPLAPLETAFRALPTPEFGTPVSMAEHLGKDVVRQLRGIGGLATEPPSSASPAGLFTSALSLRAEPESVVGPWMRQFTLESPRR